MIEEYYEETVEFLDEEFRKTLLEIENIAQRVEDKEIDAYEGFMLSEKYNNKAAEIGNKLKAMGIDLSTMEY